MVVEHQSRVTTSFFNSDPFVTREKLEERAAFKFFLDILEIGPSADGFINEREMVRWRKAKYEKLREN